MASKAPFQSDFAIIDVKSGRHALAKRIAHGAKVRVQIEMVLNSQNSRDDGVSIEFSGEVVSVSEMEAA